MAKTTKKDEGVKFYELGEKATNFADTKTGKKISGDQIVGFSVQERKSERFKTAKRGGHIVETDAPDVEEVEDDDEEEEIDPETNEGKLAIFNKLTAKEMKAFLKETYELDEDELKAVDAANKTVLAEKYTELLEADEDDEDSE